MDSHDHEDLNSIENGISDFQKSNKEMWNRRTPQNMSSSLLRKKSDPILVSKGRFGLLSDFLTNLQEVILGTKLALLFPAIPLAIVADFYHFGRVSFICINNVYIDYMYIFYKFLAAIYDRDLDRFRRRSKLFFFLLLLMLIVFPYNCWCAT